MLKQLAKYKQACPAWLGQLREKLTLSVLRENLDNLLKHTLVYPGSGEDWSPIRQTVGVVHSYIFFDFHAERKKMLRLLRDAAPLKNAVLCTNILTFETQSLRSDEDVLPRYYLPQPERATMRDQGFGLWALYQTQQYGRVSVVILQQEAIGGIAALFAPRQLAPQILVLQDHGFGANCWSSFGEPYHCLINQHKLTWPQILIVGNDYHKFREKGYYRELCRDIPTESGNMDERKICVRR
jgi:hypothetical protein